MAATQVLQHLSGERTVFASVQLDMPFEVKSEGLEPSRVGVGQRAHDLHKHPGDHLLAARFLSSDTAGQAAVSLAFRVRRTLTGWVRALPSTGTRCRDSPDIGIVISSTPLV